MRRVPSNLLKPGMELASHVYGINGSVLLAKGVRLTNSYISRLIKKGIQSVYIEDDISRDIYISDVVLEETRLQAKTHIKKTIGNVFAKSINRDTIRIKEIKSTVSDIMSQLTENKNIIYDLIDIRSIDDYLFSHSVNVCILSLLTGISMGYNTDQLENLAVGAILHDIGKGLIPPYILNKPGNLTEPEFNEIKKHPRYSLELLRTNPDVSGVSRVIAYQHHEKHNGEGYPLGKAGRDILDTSQIVGMVDMYDAITSNRCYREAIPPNEAYELLSGSGNVYFKYEIIKDFLSKVAAYPSGTVVELSTSQIAIVASNTSGFPITPKVRVMLDPDGALLWPFEELDLTGKVDIVIKRVLKESEVQPIFELIKSRRTAAAQA